ncbi:hypothetical protein TNCV_3184401 [Trichonephila clavipes]|nr:hypothetical protein TNCV_3184401 [Trichonephila clavipes]
MQMRPFRLRYCTGWTTISSCFGHLAVRFSVFSNDRSGIAVQRLFDIPPRGRVPDWKYVSMGMDAFRAMGDVSKESNGPLKTVRAPGNMECVCVSIHTASVSHQTRTPKGKYRTDIAVGGIPFSVTATLRVPVWHGRPYR